VQRSRLAGAIVAALVAAGSPAWADHVGVLGTAPLSPALVGLLAGGLAILTGLLVTLVVRLLCAQSEHPE